MDASRFAHDLAAQELGGDDLTVMADPFTARDASDRGIISSA
jgi:hypothetical protein